MKSGCFSISLFIKILFTNLKFYCTIHLPGPNLPPARKDRHGFIQWHVCVLQVNKSALFRPQKRSKNTWKTWKAHRHTLSGCWACCRLLGASNAHTVGLLNKIGPINYSFPLRSWHPLLCCVLPEAALSNKLYKGAAENCTNEHSTELKPYLLLILPLKLT